MPIIFNFAVEQSKVLTKSGSPGPDLDQKKPCNRESKALLVYHDHWAQSDQIDHYSNASLLSL